MNHPLRARYGAKDNRHDLLEWEGPALPPPELLALTDKPTGHLAPGDRWWPSVGCGPVGSWWALWWTLPDENAHRGGMVRSEVALWRLDAVGSVDDLRPVMSALAGLETIPPSSVELLLAVAEALVSTDTKHPPVLPDLVAWPGIIADLWTRLWPEARRDFSARVALSPPQGGESVAPPCLYGVPGKRILEWSAHQVIALGSAPVQGGRTANWLVGEDDPRLEEVLASCNVRPARLAGLKSVARAADRLDALRQSPSPRQALEFLRTLLILAPDSDTATNLKTEALRALNQGFPNAHPDFVLSLKNLDPAALPVEGRPDDGLAAWIKRQASDLSLAEATQFLQGLAPKQAQTWWQQAVSQALSTGLANPEPRWAKAALNWLGLSGCASVLDSILPMDKAVETCLFEASSQVEIAKAGLQPLRQQTVQRGWSRLHAWAVMRDLPPREALQTQRTFPHDPLLGLEFLIRRLPGVDVVEEAIATHDPHIIQALAQRTAREPELLMPLYASKPAWLALWAAHVSAGGIYWPEGANRETLGNGLLDAVVDGNEPLGLVAVLAKDLADIALQYSKREELWGKLSLGGSAALLPQVADALIRQCNTALDIPVPERKLAEAVVKQLRDKPPSAKMLAEILSWGVSLSEREVISWLAYPKREEWKPSIAAAVGKAVYTRGWANAANEIFRRCKSIPELRPGLEACRNLLSWWDQCLLSWSGAVDKSVVPNEDVLVRRVAELGADLAPEELDSIWERAGGKRKDLKDGGTPSARWQEAATLAHKGTLKDGLGGLAQELERIRPYNPDLQELRRLLPSSRISGRQSTR